MYWILLVKLNFVFSFSSFPNSSEKVSVTHSILVVSHSDITDTVQRNDSKQEDASKSISLLQKIHAHSRRFENGDGIIGGDCVLCSKQLSQSWFEWSRHLLQHTNETKYYCTNCEEDVADLCEHERCPSEQIINIFGKHEVGTALEGFICKKCDHLKINDYRLLEHLQADHSTDGFFETDVERVVLVSDVRPQHYTIPSGFAYIPPSERYRCGVGKCSYHAKNTTDYSDHFGKVHSIIKTYFCRFCKKIINRMSRQTVPLREILQHLDLHSSHIYQCYHCVDCFTSKDQMQTHLMADHSDLAIKYWHNERQVNNTIRNCEHIEIILDCSICNVRVDCKAAAIDHFRTKHSGCQFNFNALKIIKDTTAKLYVTCSTDVHTVCYREVFGCTVCSENFADKAQWLGHFWADHPDELLTARHHLKWMKASVDTAHADEMAYQRLFLFSCAYCPLNSSASYQATIDECYTHWRRTHFTPSEAKPFQFHVAELAKCNYCNTIATFHDLKTHIADGHDGKPFVALKAFEFRKICALCNYCSTNAENEESDLIKHYRKEHAVAMQSNVANPMPMDDSILSRLLQVSTHKKGKCQYCGDAFQTVLDLRVHCAKEHPEMASMFKLIGNCCRSPINSKSFLVHLAHHKHTLGCDKCQFQTTDTYAFVSHQVDCHQRGSTTVPEKYRNFLEFWYWRSELHFNNGLAINKLNACGTRFDDSPKFERLIEALIEDKAMKTMPNNGHDNESDDEYISDDVKSDDDVDRAADNVDNEADADADDDDEIVIILDD